MTAPNIAAITASLERSLQNFSLNKHHQSSTSKTSSSSSNSSGGGAGGGDGGGEISRRTSNSDLQASSNQFHHDLSEEPTFELNSHVTLPYHWEQCLDLKTGEIYYINWRTGMKAKDDPRTLADQMNGEVYSEDDSSYDSEESSTESSPPSSGEKYHYNYNYNNNNNNNNNNNVVNQSNEKDHVLVVAGCKICLMYFMVPKSVEDCPKCCGQLLHFDKSDNGSP